MTSPDVISVSRRDLLLLLECSELGNGREQDAALRRLEVAAEYDRTEHRAPHVAVARFQTNAAVEERDNQIMRLVAEPPPRRGAPGRHPGIPLAASTYAGPRDIWKRRAS